MTCRTTMLDRQLCLLLYGTHGTAISANPSVQRNINGTWAKETNSRSNLWTVNVFGTYEHSFMDALNLKVMAGGTAERYQYSEFSATQKRSSECRPTIPWSYYRYSNSDQKQVSNARNHRATAGFFGRINLDWKGIYLLEFNGRYDGSSRFPAADQWAFFPRSRQVTASQKKVTSRALV